jgi:hypothetical protein
MTRMRNIVLGGIAALAIGSFATSAMAAQGFENRLSGATIGLPLGALPPPGLYTGLETAYLGMVGNSGQATGGGPFLPAIAQAVPLLYVPGWNFLGANYAMSVVFAFYENSNCGVVAACSPGAFGGGNNTGAVTQFTTANPTWNPITLSWNLGGGWFVSAGLNFMAPIGTVSFASGSPNPDYWTVEPTFAVAYLANNWVIAGNFFYDINGNSPGTMGLGAPGTSTGLSVTPGNSLYGDLTAAYKFGKWELGPVLGFQVQTTNDTGPGCGPRTCANITQVSLGGLVGYDFGPVDLQVWVTDMVAAQNSPEGVGGINIFTRLGFRLWAPDAPKPLVAKN